MSFGRNTFTNSTVLPTRLSADGSPEYKAGGLTIDWSTVTATGTNAATTLADGSTIAIATKYLRYGQVVTKITTGGKFGPYDPDASDGRQTLTRGECFLMDETILEYPSGVGLSGQNSHVGSAVEGGKIFLGRVLQSGAASNSASLAAGPTKANFIAAFPGVFLVED